jgi:hypothetical protein
LVDKVHSLALTQITSPKNNTPFAKGYLNLTHFIMKTSFILLALAAAVGGFAAATPDNEARGDYDYYKPKCHKDKCLKSVRKHPEQCKKHQVVIVKIYETVWTTYTSTIYTTTSKYCPPPKHDYDDYKPPKKHYIREAEAEAEPEAEAEAEAGGYKPPYVTAYPTYCPSYCPSTDRYASACSCVGYPKYTKTIKIPTTKTKTTYTTITKTKKCPKPTKHYEPPKHDYPPKKDY